MDFVYWLVVVIALIVIVAIISLLIGLVAKLFYGWTWKTTWSKIGGWIGKFVENIP